MKQLKLVAALILMFCSAQAQAAWYVSGLGGVHLENGQILPSSLEFSLNPGYYVGTAAGYRFSESLGTELEFVFSRNQIKNATFHNKTYYLDDESYYSNTLTLMGNVLTYFSTGYPVTPYLGAGLGYGYNRVWVTAAQITHAFNLHGFCYQFIVGASYPLRCGRELAMEYRYLSISQHSGDHNIGLKLTQLF